MHYNQGVIPHVPVLRPTEDEFANPLTFIQKMKQFGETFGIVKVVTPERKTFEET